MGVHADVDQERLTVRVSELTGLDCERGPHGALGIVFRRDGRPQMSPVTQTVVGFVGSTAAPEKSPDRAAAFVPPPARSSTDGWSVLRGSVASLPVAL